MPEKLRIAMLGHKRIPSREGGVEIVVEELSARMAAMGHAVTCYNRKGHHVGGKAFDEEKREEYRGVKLKRVFTLDKKGLAAVTASVSGAFRAAFGKYDVVHFHAEGPCAMLWLPKLFGKRCVATIHGLDHQRAKWGRFASWYIRTGEKCAARFADEVIVLSENVKRYFKETYGRETAFIPNGVLPAQAAEADAVTSLYGLEKDGYLLFLGRLVPEKGVHDLIEAYKGLKTDRKLVIAGGSSDSEGYLRDLQTLAGGDERIVFTGFVQGRLLEELYSNAYLYVLPSHVEGMPLSLLEAMSYGNCCLTSDIPECTEVIGEFGAVFRRGDKASLREQLQRLCDEPESVRLYKEQAAAYICSRYDWDDVTERTLALYGARPVGEKEEQTDQAYEGIAGK